MLKKKIRRRVTRIETRPQWSLELFEGDPALEQPTMAARRAAIRFEDPDPRDIRFGVQRLDEHLHAMGLRDALVLRQMLVELDWSAFEAHYSPVGRPGYAPWLMAGVVLFGLMRGVSSLRELERFTRSDLECMWVGGGITPDHSILGRFIVRHEQELNGPLFESITQAVLQRTGSGRERLAGDGTVLEAMSSRYALIKREALEAQRAQLREQAESKPEQADELAQIERACEALAERPSAKAVVVNEPEAGLLKLKNGRGSRPAYQVTVLANKARVVVDAQMHSTSEQAALTEQLQRIDGTQTRELLLDAGFNTYAILESTLAKEISLLCPDQAEHAREGEGVIPLRQFRYVEEGDYYLCPAGQQLHPCRRYAGNPATGQRAYVQYTTPACAACEQRAQCTRGKQRTIQRSAGQELKEVMRLVMAQLQARQAFAQRKAMVEPVFSTLRERQGLNRFRRRGLNRVRLEFRLHLMAYNLGRALAYARRGLWGQFLGLCRLIRALCRRLRDDQSICRGPIDPAPAVRSIASVRMAA
jgi:transposase